MASLLCLSTASYTHICGYIAVTGRQIPRNRGPDATAARGDNNGGRKMMAFYLRFLYLLADEPAGAIFKGEKKNPMSAVLYRTVRTNERPCALPYSYSYSTGTSTRQHIICPPPPPASGPCDRRANQTRTSHSFRTGHSVLSC